MTERIVTYNLKVVGHKGNKKELARFHKEVKAAYDTTNKYSAKSTAARAKDEKKAADAGIKEARRAGKVAEQMLARKEKLVARAAAEEVREGRKAAAQMIQTMRGREREEDRARKTREREEKRASDKIARQSIKNHEAISRAGKRTWEATRTPLERYNNRVAELDGLLKRGVVSQNTHTRAVRNARLEMNNAGNAGVNAFGPKALAMVNKMTAAFGMGLGLAGAVQLARSEYQSWLDTLQKSRQATMTTAEAEAEALKNLGANTPQQREAYISLAEQVQRNVGQVRLRNIHLAMSAAISARGNLPLSAAAESVKAAAQFSPESAEDMQAITIGALGVRQVVGADQVSSEGAIGFNVGIGMKSLPKDPAVVALQSTPVLQAVTAAGGTPEEAGALWAMLTQKMRDPMGRKSKTAAINLVQRLVTAFPRVAKERLASTREEIEKASEPVAKHRAQLAAAEARLVELKTPETLSEKELAASEEKLGLLQAMRVDPRKKEAHALAIEKQRAKIAQLKAKAGPASAEKLADIAFLESDVAGYRENVAERARLARNLPRLKAQLPELQRDVLIGTSGTFGDRLQRVVQRPGLRKDLLKTPFEAGANQSLTSLLSGGSAYTMYKQFESAIPDPRTTGPLFRQRLDVHRGSELQQLAGHDRTITSLKDEMARSSPGKAALGSVMDNVPDILKQTGMSAIQTKISEFQIGIGGVEKAIEIIERRQEDLLDPRGAVYERWSRQFGTTFGGDFGASSARSLAGSPSPATAQDREQAAILGRLVDELQKLVANLDKGEDRDRSVDVADEVRQVGDILRDIRSQGDRADQAPANDFAPRTPGLPTGGRNPGF